MKLVPRSKRIPSQIYPVELGGWPGWYVRGILFFYFERHKTLAGSVLQREMEIECLFIIVYNSGGKRGGGGLGLGQTDHCRGCYSRDSRSLARFG